MLGLGRVPDRLHVLLVEMLEAREHDALAAGLRQRIEVILDLDDGRRGVAHLPEEFEAHRADRRRHLVQDEARARDEAVAAFLLHTGQGGQELVGDVLAKAGLAERRAGNGQGRAAKQRLAVGLVIGAIEGRLRGVVDLAEVVVGARDLQPLRRRRDHPPGRQVVERGAPQHRLLAAGVHGHVAADAGSVRGGWVAGEDQARAFRRVHHAAGDHTRACFDRRGLRCVIRKDARLDFGEALQFFSVDHRRARIEGNRATGVAGAAAARNDREPQVDAAFDEAAHFLFGVGVDHDERILDAPVGGVGDVRHAREAVERDVALVGVDRERATRALAQVLGLVESRGEAIDRGGGGGDQAGHLLVALRIGARRRAAFLDLADPVAHRIDKEPLPLGVIEKIVLQVRVAVDDPDVAQDLEQHPRRAAGPALAS
jgi:hypothetical protein